MVLSKQFTHLARCYPGLFVFIFLLFVQSVNAQQATGTLVDVQSGKPVMAVCLTNRTQHSVAYSNDSGFFSIEANVGDTILIRHPSYITLKRAVPENHQLGVIKMTVSGYSLEEFTVAAKKKDYKRDSLERQIIYRKTLKDAAERPTASFSNGLVLNGGVSYLASAISGRTKKLKRFKKQFDADEQDRFIRTRYNIEIVARFTRMDADSAALFIKAFPMEVAYARAATDLEMAMWIREHYRKWIGKH